MMINIITIYSDCYMLDDLSRQKWGREGVREL